MKVVGIFVLGFNAGSLFGVHNIFGIPNYMKMWMECNVQAAKMPGEVNAHEMQVNDSKGADSYYRIYFSSSSSDCAM